LTFFTYHLSSFDLVIVALVALFIGMAKTGVHGAGMMAVPMLAAVFGGQLSSGIMLPMLCLADIFGVWYYHRHASWPHLKKLFPWAALGTIVGTIVGGYIDDEVFRVIMATIIVSSVGIMLWLERGHKQDVPDYVWFAALMGVAGGFTSMVGNLAGSVMAVYFLSMRLPKNAYIGTTAWFFMVINWFKIPFHVFAWNTISVDTFYLSLATLPAIILGAYLGIALVKIIPEKIYRWFIIGMTLLAAVMMLLK
jgi:uncharacterized protein